MNHKGHEGRSFVPTLRDFVCFVVHCTGAGAWKLANDKKILASVRDSSNATGLHHLRHDLFEHHEVDVVTAALLELLGEFGKYGRGFLFSILFGKKRNIGCTG